MHQKHRSGEVSAAMAAIKILAALVAFSLCAPAPAHAYIDPGSGALIWQMLLVGFFSGLFYFRRAIGHVKGWFTGKSKKPEDTQTDVKDSIPPS